MASGLPGAEVTRVQQPRPPPGQPERPLIPPSSRKNPRTAREKGHPSRPGRGLHPGLDTASWGHDCGRDGDRQADMVTASPRATRHTKLAHTCVNTRATQCDTHGSNMTHRRRPSVTAECPGACRGLAWTWAGTRPSMVTNGVTWPEACDLLPPLVHRGASAEAAGRCPCPVGWPPGALPPAGNSLPVQPPALKAPSPRSEGMLLAGGQLLWKPPADHMVSVTGPPAGKEAGVCRPVVPRSLTAV